MNEEATLLVIDDEAQIRKFLRISLGAQGYGVVDAVDGASGVLMLRARRPDLVILDLGLPDRDGQLVVQDLRRESDVPIIVLSVRADEHEKILALDNGANDFVTKPFGIGELLARVRAALRGRISQVPEVVTLGDLTLDRVRHQVTLAGAPLRLTRREFGLLALLMDNAGRVLTHRNILRNIWGPTHEEDVQYLRVYVGQLRHKLGDDPGAPRYIANEPGVGYRFLPIE